jgi:hypothetical protein
MTPEQEWRKLLLSKIEKIEDKVDRIDKEMTTLKVKIAFFSSIVGGIASFVANKIFNHP